MPKPASGPGTLDRDRRILGEDHPDTLISATSLTIDLRVTGYRSPGSACRQETASATRLPSISAARGVRYSRSLLFGRRSTGLPAKEPIQEPTQADFRRRPATPGDCRGWSSAQ